MKSVGRLLNKKAPVIILVCLLWISVLLFTVYAAALNNVTIVSGLKATSTGSGDWTHNNGELNGSVAVKATSGCTGTSYSSQSGTLTLTNTSGSGEIVSLNYEI